MLNTSANSKNVLIPMIYTGCMLFALVWVIFVFSWKVEKLEKENQKLSAYIEVITHPDVCPINRKQKLEENK